MTPQTRTSLKELQTLDQEIVAVRTATESFESLLEEVDAPVLRLEQEVQALDKRLTEIRLEENRLELTIEERQVRLAKLKERMEAVRNVREEAAVHAELEMVRRALESEEQEALSLLDQIKRLEDRYEEEEGAYQEAVTEVGPRREELVQEQQATKDKLETLETDREAFAAGIDPGERRVYDSIMAGARDVALAELTHDGACGNCYNMVPLQIQNQIRHTDTMFRCEGCGVILTPESAEGLARAKEEGERIEQALKHSTEERDLERAIVAEAIALEEAEEAIAQLEEAEGAIAQEASAAAKATEEAQSEEAQIEEAAASEVPSKELVFADIASDDAPAEASAGEGAAPDHAQADGLVFEDVAAEHVPDKAAPVEDAIPDEARVAEPTAENGAADDVPAGEVSVEVSITDDASSEERPDEEPPDEEPPDEETESEPTDSRPADSEQADSEQAEKEEPDPGEDADAEVVAERLGAEESEPQEPNADA